MDDSAAANLSANKSRRTLPIDSGHAVLRLQPRYYNTLRVRFAKTVKPGGCGLEKRESEREKVDDLLLLDIMVRAMELSNSRPCRIAKDSGQQYV